ncbi:MAG: glycosyltransferase family 25 protein [Actinomycetota bacterium]
MEIFVVNLVRSLERRSSICRQLDALGLGYRLFEATDGGELSQEELSTLCETEARAKYAFTPGQIGCAHTYRRIYQTMDDEQIDVALILEDDVELPPDLPALVQAVERNLRDDEIILLLGLPAEGCRLSTLDTASILDRYQLRYPMTPYQLVSTTAFMLRRPVAARLADLMSPIRTCSDWWGVLHSQGAFKSLRCVWPSPIKLKLHFPSDIRTRQKRHPIVRLLHDLANDTRLVPLNALMTWNRRRATREVLSAAGETDERSPLAPGAWEIQVK